jgi:hypothetical protein
LEGAYERGKPAKRKKPAKKKGTQNTCRENANNLIQIESVINPPCSCSEPAITSGAPYVKRYVGAEPNERKPRREG